MKPPTNPPKKPISHPLTKKISTPNTLNRKKKKKKANPKQHEYYLLVVGCQFSTIFLALNDEKIKKRW